MNKFFLTVLGIASLSLMFSCGNGENESNNTDTQDKTTTEQADSTKNQPEESLSEETKDTEQTGPLNADTVKPGDKIEGLTVISADYTAGRLFAAHFEGEITLEGTLQQNPMEYTNEFYPGNSPIQVEISEETYDLFQTFTIENFKDLENKLSDEQKTMLESGQVVPMTITIANPVSNLYFGSKGRRADGTCRFVKMQ